MSRFDALAICPHYLRSGERTITCEGLEQGYAHTLRFGDTNKKNMFFDGRCGTFAYRRCPYCRAQEKRYGS